MTKESVIYALSDGAKNCWSALKALLKHCKKMITILDWEHIGRKFKNVEQSLVVDYHKRLESAKWKLWHGKKEDCLEKLNAKIDTVALQNIDIIKKLEEISSLLSRVNFAQAST